MYVERIKPYEYRLECGFLFSSETLSVADEYGLHNFPCRRCKGWHEYEDDELVGLQREAASARDMVYVSRLDKAIIKDRIVRDLRIGGDKNARKDIIKRYGVSDSTVYRIAVDLGLSDSDGWDDTVRSLA